MALSESYNVVGYATHPTGVPDDEHLAGGGAPRVVPHSHARHAEPRLVRHQQQHLLAEPPTNRNRLRGQSHEWVGGRVVCRVGWGCGAAGATA